MIAHYSFIWGSHAALRGPLVLLGTLSQLGQIAQCQGFWMQYCLGPGMLRTTRFTLVVFGGHQATHHCAQDLLELH